MRALKGMVAGALALGGLLVVQSQAEARAVSVPALTPMVVVQAGDGPTCGWGHRVWHGHRYYGWRRHYGWHRPYGFYRPVYHGWHRPYGWHRPWHHHGWHRW